jgi:hypothetical protein
MLDYRKSIRASDISAYFCSPTHNILDTLYDFHVIGCKSLRRTDRPVTVTILLPTLVVVFCYAKLRILLFGCPCCVRKSLFKTVAHTHWYSEHVLETIAKISKSISGFKPGV